eukprot:Colp12_sorted_trinity150504_noHs@16106
MRIWLLAMLLVLFVSVERIAAKQKTYEEITQTNWDKLADDFDADDDDDDEASLIRPAHTPTEHLKGKTVMVAAGVPNKSKAEIEQLSLKWKIMMHNLHIVTEHAMMDEMSTAFLVQEGTLAHDVKEFLLSQPEVEVVLMDGKTYSKDGKTRTIKELMSEFEKLKEQAKLQEEVQAKLEKKQKKKSKAAEEVVSEDKKAEEKDSETKQEAPKAEVETEKVEVGKEKVEKGGKEDSNATEKLGKKVSSKKDGKETKKKKESSKKGKETKEEVKEGKKSEKEKKPAKEGKKEKKSEKTKQADKKTTKSRAERRAEAAEL